MTLEQLKVELEKCSDADRAAIQAWLEERELESKLKRRIAEADADPSIMIPGDEVFARLRATQEKRRAERNLSPSSRD